MRIDSHHSFTERYTLDYLGAILKRNRFEGSVLVADHLPAVPEFVRGVVVTVDLHDPQLPHRLDEYQRHPLFKGICARIGDEVPAALAELEHRGILLDADCPPGVIPGIVERFPALHIALDHVGMCDLPEDDWARDLAAAAQFPQVFCKLSAIARVPRHYVRHALAMFGAARLMFGSDWPYGLPDTTWKASLAAFTQAIGAQTIEFREQLLGATAERFYHI